MKILFDYEGHKIVVSRGIIASELSIDGQLQDTCNGFTKNQMNMFDLCGFIDQDGQKTAVKIHVDVKLFHDDVALYVGEKLIEKKKSSFF